MVCILSVAGFYHTLLGLYHTAYSLLHIIMFTISLYIDCSFVIKLNKFADFYLFIFYVDLFLTFTPSRLLVFCFLRLKALHFLYDVQRTPTFFICKP